MHNVVTKEDLDALTSKHPLVVLDFWGPKCKPCLDLAPVLHDLEKIVPGVAFAQTKVDHHSAELCDMFNVASIPMVTVLARGEVKDTVIGNNIAAIIRMLVTQYTAVYDV